MRNYLSFGGGVNSTALYLLLLELEIEFEATFVDHKTDFPETYEYVEYFKNKYPLTILTPKRHKSLYEFCWEKRMFPNRKIRWCTSDFKSKPLQDYAKAPCFVHIGFDYDEKHRAKIYSHKGQEFRYLLIENQIGRAECKQIIKRHGLKVPIKSGCFICPFQRVGSLRKMRREQPEIFCKLEKLENRNNKERIRKNLGEYYSFRKPVRAVAEKGIEQKQLFKKDEYPPCYCGL